MGTILESLSLLWHVLTQFAPPKPTFSPNHIPDLTGRVMIVTGGNTGIGKETIKALLEHNAKVYMACRDEVKAELANRELKEQTGREAIFLELDLASLASVKKAAQEFLSKERELHVLFNNAGVMVPPIDWLTKDGYDMQFGTNVLGHWYFTELLMPALLEGAKTSPDGHARIVTTSSSAAYFATVTWDSLRDGPTRRKLGPQKLYCQSKFLNVVMAREFAKRYGDKGIISVSVNPGNLKTDLQRHTTPFQRKLINLMLYPAPYGALTQLWGGLMPEPLKYSGEFLVPWARLGRCRPEAYDDAIGERLWNYLEEQVKNK
ncbi:NAD(P)-binding protein [Obba rivulosa]|uniref:NAD(P)-binding protein n=1 Tax=Obba rivulosa TaxID=1052685 RepID=A0A8E2DKP3_9APHY|nr:NAD(P)-binding protein [Obba rivulosa]